MGFQGSGLQGSGFRSLGFRSSDPTSAKTLKTLFGQIRSTQQLAKFVQRLSKIRNWPNSVMTIRIGPTGTDLIRTGRSRDIPWSWPEYHTHTPRTRSNWPKSRILLLLVFWCLVRHWGSNYRICPSSVWPKVGHDFLDTRRLETFLKSPHPQMSSLFLTFNHCGAQRHFICRPAPR